MYKRLLWLAMVCIFVFVAGCNAKETQNKNENTTNPSTQTTQENSKDFTNEMPNSDPPPKMNEKENDETGLPPTKIKKSTDEVGDRIIHYPQLANMPNESMEKNINQLIKNEITTFSDQYSDAALSVDFQITIHTDDNLSILYLAQYNGGMYPTQLIFTTNIDLKNGEKIKLSEMVMIHEDFAHKLKNSPYLDLENPSTPNEEKKGAVLDYLNSIHEQELVHALKQGDQPTMDSNPYGVYSYLEDHSVVVSIQVPHALGDHAEFKIFLD